ncbi:hypothetical protein [Armatimonas rosea]|uniref:Uncharacterized protein n=1 Tax=Armatimonas rosea TaxID=685828 RepID=A0A7W9W7V0_ARMRO|nr:hypothetical protein [Armatimonas rosea]MBB6052068.1 hypothetical protein [Armatimonas rosea]
MTWSALDIVVALVFFAQLVGWCAVGAALWKIKAGPVTRLQTRTLPLAKQGQQLARSGATLAQRLKGRTLAVLTRTRAIRGHFNVTEAPEGMWIEPRHVRQALSLVQALRLRGKAPAQKPRRKKSLAVKLGLVPPALTRLAPLGKFAKLALQAARQLRR